MSEGVLPGYRGHVDAIEPVLSGWLVEIARPAEPVSLLVSLDGAHRLAVIADRPRPDVFAAGLGGSGCGFSVELPPHCLDGDEHGLALLLPDGRDLRLPGMPPRVALGPVRADIVAAGGGDLDPVLDLLRRTEVEAGFDPGAVTRENAAAFDAIRTPEQGCLFFARTGTRLVGYGRLERGSGVAAGLGVVALTVLAAYRRKGLGEALLRTLLDTAAKTGLSQVWLSVRPDNTPAIRLYEKLGFFRETSRPPGLWAIPGEMTMVCPVCNLAGP
jgi:ribosomal protein S18 acetylase RimI-like enzyme